MDDRSGEPLRFCCINRRETKIAKQLTGGIQKENTWEDDKNWHEDDERWSQITARYWVNCHWKCFSSEIT